MAAASPNFVAEQQALYEATRAQAAARNAHASQPDAEVIAEENATSCVSYAPPNSVWPRWDDDSAGPSISIADLTSTSKEQVVDSAEDE